MREAIRKPKIVLITTSAASLWVFFSEQCKYLREQGFEVAVLCAPGPELQAFTEVSGCAVYPIPMDRSVNPLGDLVSLFGLVRTLRQLNPDLVHTHTPKAGLLGMLAAALAACPIRMHTFHGLRSEGLGGVKRSMMDAMETLTARLSTSSLAVSGSLRDRLIERKVIAPEKISVLGYGGCAGVDLSYFARERYVAEAQELRRLHHVAIDAPVVTYIGRIARDKGIEVLVEAWPGIKREFPLAHLFVTGPLDDTDPVSPAALQALQHDASVSFDPSFTTQVPALLAASNVFVSPSFREGLGVTILEASAMRVPVVVTQVTGIVDAAQHQVTGLFIPPRDANALERAVCQLLHDSAAARRMGDAGRRFVEQRFNRSQVFKWLERRYVAELVHASTKAQVVTPSALITPARRIIDATLAAFFIVLTAPVLLSAALAVLLTMGRPIFFRQWRAGLHGKPFEIVKLRTMLNTGGWGSTCKSDALRLTALGRILRKLSIDELPQLLNVLRGEMTFVGPRPLLTTYLARYDDVQMRRHNVLPGITGWTQVNGRNACSWDQKFELDVWYVEHKTVLLDLRIVWLTLLRLLKPRGIAEAGSCTMSEFLGTPGVSGAQQR